MGAVKVQVAVTAATSVVVPRGGRLPSMHLPILMRLSVLLRWLLMLLLPRMWTYHRIYSFVRFGYQKDEKEWAPAFLVANGKHLAF